MVNGDILTDRFRAAMASTCAPVTIVTAMSDVGPHGTTVSAFASLSLNPVLAVACMNHDSDLLAIVKQSRKFGVNVLASEQAHLAVTFARKQVSRFEAISWTAQHGLPRLTGVHAWLACEVWDLARGGDHTMVVGRVLDADVCVETEPLTYHRRTFGTHTALVTQPSQRSS